MFPYQRRNRSCSPDKMDLSISGIANKTPTAILCPSPIPKPDQSEAVTTTGTATKCPAPVIAKSFIFGSQAQKLPTKPNKSREAAQILNAITKSQEKAGEKQYIIDDLESFTEAQPAIEPTVATTTKPAKKVDPNTDTPHLLGQNAAPNNGKTLKVLKAPTALKSRHRRVTSQVIDKQTLNRLLFENCEVFGEGFST